MRSFLQNALVPSTPILLPVLILVFWSMKFCRRQIFIVGGKISTCRHILTGLWKSVVIGLRIKILAHNN